MLYLYQRTTGNNDMTVNYEGILQTYADYCVNYGLCKWYYYIYHRLLKTPLILFRSCTSKVIGRCHRFRRKPVCSFYIRRHRTQRLWQNDRAIKLFGSGNRVR